MNTTGVTARLAVGLFCLAASAAAQERRPTVTTLSAIVDSVERAGAQWERDTTVVFVPTTSAGAATQTSQRRCVETRGMQSVRSGEFTVWGQLNFVTPKVIVVDSATLASSPFATWLASGSASGKKAVRGQKVGWTPLHRPTRGSFEFEFWPVDQSATLPTISASIAHPSGGGPAFISSSLSIPQPGVWVVVVTNGPDWGCFIFRKT